ncbi:exonuclease mut-7 homolog isoform X1 [Haliotis asinina]|uniref:exonuclease mut-7 homolog isoform X1 n=1 Tax=Haliotis asinina TaxID=109174 RepID=UPI0035326F71
MFVIVSGLWIVIRYFIYSLTRKDTADKAVQVDLIKEKPVIVENENPTRPCRTLKRSSGDDYTSQRCHQKTSKVLISGKSVCVARRENTPTQSCCKSSELIRTSPYTKMAEAPTNFTEIRKANPNPSTWLRNCMKQPAQTSTNEMKEWLDQIEVKWFDEGNANRAAVHAQVSELLTQHFITASNPYSACIYMIERCRDFYTGKTTTLSFYIMKEFERWTRHSKKKMDDLLSQDIRFHAFLMATERHMTLFDMAVKAFKLRHIGNDYFLPEIKKFLEKGKHKEACHCAGKLGLQGHFSMQEIILPLLLQDKVNLVESYVIGNPEQQKAVVQLLDHLCDRETDINRIIESSGVQNVKRDKLQKKTLSKLAVRLMKLYQIPQEHCPNISNARGVGALKYLMYKRYIEKTFGSGSWDEMVKNAVGENDFLKEQLVEQLMCYNDLPEAAKWAMIYRLGDDKLPRPVREAKERMASEQPGHGATGGWDDTGGENWDDDCYTEQDLQKYYHSLSVPLEQITLVDTRDKLSVCVARLCVPGTVIGIDSEWKPAFAAQPQRVALMQFAVMDHVYLIDCTTLRSTLTDQDWADFTGRIFCNKDTVKLGYGLETDLTMFTKTFPSMKEPLMRMKRVVNVEDLSKQIFGDGPVVLDESAFMSDGEDGGPSGGGPSGGGPSGGQQDKGEGSVKPYSFSKKEERGLSELVRQCLGKPLCKVEQMSDWEKRPLRQAQMVYAALDAYVLLEVYTALTSHARQMGLQINLEPPVCAKWSKPSKTDKKRAKAAGKSLEPRTLPETPRPAQSGPPITPHQLRVVVDTMLQGLGKHLRSCGVDVVILEANNDHEKAVMISKEQGRIALSSGYPYKMIRSHVGEAMCYSVVSQKAGEQAMEVLKHFNVKVTQKDIFSRCQVCNGDEYLEIPASDLKILYDRKLQLESEKSRTNSSNNVTVSSMLGNLSSDGAHFLKQYNVDWGTVTVATSGAPLQVEAVHKSKFESVELFYCCANCGKVFWEGSHFSRVCDQFSHVLSIDDNQTVYDRLRKQSS